MVLMFIKHVNELYCIVNVSYKTMKTYFCIPVVGSIAPWKTLMSRVKIVQKFQENCNMKFYMVASQVTDF